jgi:hypothetical protein
MDNQSLPFLLARLSRTEQIRVIMTHPFFTGKCPHCKYRIPLAKAALGRCKCSGCGWSDLESQHPGDLPETEAQGQSMLSNLNTCI